jgi:hypothetical protein
VPQVAIAEVKSVMPIADPHHHGDHHGDKSAHEGAHAHG